MMTSVRKTLKTLVCERQTDRFLAKFALKITRKSAVFLPIAFRPSLPRKCRRNSREIGRFFRDFFRKKSREIWLFFRDLLEALLRIVWHNLLQWTVKKTDFCFLCVIVTIVNPVYCFKRNVLYSLLRQIKVTHVFKKHPSLYPSRYSMNSWSVCLFVLL